MEAWHATVNGVRCDLATEQQQLLHQNNAVTLLSVHEHTIPWIFFSLTAKLTHLKCSILNNSFIKNWAYGFGIGVDFFKKKF